MHHFNLHALPGRFPFLPNAAASSFPTQQQQQLQLRARHVAVSAAATVTIGVAGVHIAAKSRPWLKPQQRQQEQQPLFLIPKELAEVICGAVGEIVQVAVLYPVDTIKVRCQAGGLPVAAVVRQLLSLGAPGAIIQQLYAGVATASLASVAVGSLYYFTFCAAKRAAASVVAAGEQKQRQQHAERSVLNSTTNGTKPQHQQQQQSAVHQYPHGNVMDCHSHDPVFAAICSDDAAAAAAAAAAKNVCCSSEQSGGAAAAALAANTSISSSNSNHELSSHGKLQANILAACAAALVGALVEAPVETFKHRAQAGQIQGNMFAHVVKALQQQGPRALYGSFFLPFCFKSLPFDIGELVTYSSLQDMREAAVAGSRGPSAAVPAPTAVSSLQQQQHGMATSGSSAAAAAAARPATEQQELLQQQQQQQQHFLASVPDHAWDMAIGGAAGAAAVLLSMPPDCIKTVMETGGGVAAAPGSGVRGSAGAFAATGRQLVKQHGAAGLFMGLAPRLVESVPSTMLYWLAVEHCRRLLEPYTAK